MLKSKYKLLNNSQNNDTNINLMNQILKFIKYKIIDISKMKAGFEIISKLPQLVRQYGNIKALKLYGNQIKDTELPKISQLLTTYSSINYIDIGCNEISDSSIDSLLEIASLSSIDTLQLGQLDSTLTVNRLHRDSLNRLLDIISKHKYIKRLGLSGLGSIIQKKDFHFFQFSTFLSNLLMNCTNLINLDISNCGLYDPDLEILSEGFYSNKNLQILNLSENIFNNCYSLIKGISSIRSIVSLNLSNIGLKSDSILPLCNSIESGWNLISLNISNNEIGTEGISKLLYQLSNHSHLVILNISNTKITPSISKFLYEFLLNNQIIQDLDISCNNLGDQVTDLLKKCLSNQNNLTYFSLSSCRISSQGGIDIIRSISTNHSLKTLILSDNFLNKESGYTFIELLQNNDTLTKIDLSSNQIDIFALEAVDTICKRNKSINRDLILEKLRNKYINLSIINSKVPSSKTKLNNLRNELSRLQNEIETVQLDINKENILIKEEYSSFLNQKQLLEQLSIDKQNAISEMNKNIEEMNSNLKLNLIDFENQIILEEKEFQKNEEEAGKITNEIEEYKSKVAIEEEFLRSETEKLEKLIIDISRASRNKNLIKDFIIPENPYISKDVKSQKTIKSNNSFEYNLLIQNIQEEKKITKKKDIKK